MAKTVMICQASMHVATNMRRLISVKKSLVRSLTEPRWIVIGLLAAIAMASGKVQGLGMAVERWCLIARTLFDVGVNLPWMSGATDLAGLPRVMVGIPFRDPVVDMGAYEMLPLRGSNFLLR